MRVPSGSSAHDLVVAVRAVHHSPLRIDGDGIRAEQRDHAVPVVELHSRVRIICSGEPAVSEKHGRLAGVRAPLVNHICGNVAEEKIAALVHPHGTFQEAEMIGKFFHLASSGTISLRHGFSRAMKL